MAGSSSILVAVFLLSAFSAAFAQRQCTVGLNSTFAESGSLGSGFGYFTISGNTVTLTLLNFTNLENVAIGATIRTAGPDNDGDGTVLFRFPDFPATRSGTYSYSMTLPDAVIAQLEQDLLFVCIGTTVHIVGEIRGPIICPPPAPPVPTPPTCTCTASEAVPGGHVIAIPGIGLDFVFAPGSGTYYESADNKTAYLYGTLVSKSQTYRSFFINVTLYNRLFSPPSGSPKLELDSNLYAPAGPIDVTTFHYYESWNGTLTGLNAYAGALIDITQFMAAWQVGVGANGVNTNYGASGWYAYTLIRQPTDTVYILQTSSTGDINIDINCPCSANATTNAAQSVAATSSVAGVNGQGGVNNGNGGANGANGGAFVSSTTAQALRPAGTPGQASPIAPFQTDKGNSASAAGAMLSLAVVAVAAVLVL